MSNSTWRSNSKSACRAKMCEAPGMCCALGIKRQLRPPCFLGFLDQIGKRDSKQYIKATGGWIQHCMRHSCIRQSSQGESKRTEFGKPGNDGKGHLGEDSASSSLERGSAGDLQARLRTAPTHRCSLSVQLHSTLMSSHAFPVPLSRSSGQGPDISSEMTEVVGTEREEGREPAHQHAGECGTTMDAGQIWVPGDKVSLQLLSELMDNAPCGQGPWMMGLLRGHQGPPTFASTCPVPKPKLFPRKAPPGSTWKIQACCQPERKGVQPTISLQTLTEPPCGIVPLSSAVLLPKEQLKGTNV
ncbi:hypothetical protein H920_12611 [Fukomys damarensis]|uniref:Uncharacterized protein n=1 Tax=Fukomys damarensis TaxID=885580 RepID=A0A091D705_FUKDA|nr:hypothetical protein H920_12611 [Fukomys damarensis]